jgi:hypothetical protein
MPTDARKMITLVRLDESPFDRAERVVVATDRAPDRAPDRHLAVGTRVPMLEYR